MAGRTRPGYEPDRRGFGEFMVSNEIGDAAFQVAQDVAAEANLADGAADLAGSFYAEPGGTLVLGKRFRNRRRIATARSDHPKAAAYEFGTGAQAEGKSRGQGRQQGGGSPARRTLQRAAQRFHNPIEAPE